ncbi:MAG: Fe-S protein assembly co-chaperone HscB [Gammaproteobacteria bacterium]|nr:Fe-S protein assembly co-chaperone HscB [Gammaproteobacteria bacterium]NIR97912.1 Fe-S protein assembly co-chaperone HscB [Gammaproteobacteria bacterium]NIT63617.1 Fe-S protein assembly co-chaperone HscB [Gammaproteobacteria bacterium]NIV20553.1 Fe-S protein assembly co-chaperone HscB [Gammaproteobacteria bacterium]NIX11147.1 Fe-S protein assembly co-chaperone HscB [Gammaproteobacteria bacterium]
MASGLSDNYFELFGLPVAFDVSPAALTERYRDLQQAVHPDRFASASDQERRLSMQRATRINEAYQALKDPLARARHLLELRGVRWDDERETVVAPEFLMEQMELHEELAQARDQAEPLAAVGHILDRVDATIRGMTDELARRFADDDPRSLERAGETVRKLQFLYRLKGEAEGLGAELEDEL